MSNEESLSANCFCCDIEMIDVSEIRFGVCNDCLQNKEVIQEVFEQGEMYCAMVFNIFQALKHKVETITEPEEFN